MKTASQSVAKWATRTGAAAQDYVAGANTTDKDQAAAGVAAKEIYKAALTASFGRDSYAKGLQKSGKAGWQAGIAQKGAQNFATGVSTSGAQAKYSANSGAYDSARGAAAGLPRGQRGSAQNLARVAAVANALHAAKTAK
jgi:hypothetical protein